MSNDYGINIEQRTIAISSNEIESDLIIATNNAINNALQEFEFGGCIITVESALSALHEIVERHTIH